jgi:hypothetical protein
MRAVQKPVADYCIRGDAVLLCLDTLDRTPAIFLQLPKCVKDMRAYYRKTFKKICAGVEFPAQAKIELS